MTIRTTIEPALQRDAEQILARCGLTLPEAIDLFLREVQLRQGLPFDARLPNAETRAALLEARHADQMSSFVTPDELFDDLGIA